MNEYRPNVIRDSRHRLQSVWLLVLMLATLVPAARAQEPSEAQVYELNYAKGVAKFNQGQYQAAEEFFSRALQANPGDPDATYYLGQTLIRSKNYVRGESVFRDLLQIEHRSGRALLGLGIALYYQGKYREALDNLAAAQQALPTDPLAVYFQGLAHNQLGNYQTATSLLTQAMLMSPELAPEGHYHRGLAHLAQGIFDEARAEFEAVIAAEPESDLARLSRQALRHTRPGPPEPAAPVEVPPKRWDATFTMSAQYDTNVVLLPLGVQPPGGPTGISRKDDYRTVLYGRGEYRFVQTGTWTVGAGYGLYQSFHRTLSGFDVQDHTPMLYVQRLMGRVQSRIDYIFDYVNVGRSPFLISHAVRPVVTIREGDRFFTQLQAGYQNKDFQHGRFLFNSARDGKNWLFGITQYVHFPNNASLVRIGYTFDTDRTGGGSPERATPGVTTNADWAYVGHRFSFGAILPEVFTLKPDLTFDYYLQRYDNPNSFSPGGTTARSDDIYIVSASVTRSLTSSLSLALQYSYTRDKSNLALFDYERSIFSLSLTGYF